MDVKRKRNDKNFTKLKEQLQKLLLDTKEGRQHKLGVALEKEGARKSNVTLTSTKADQRGCCCGNVDHQRTSSLKCPWRGELLEDMIELEREAKQQEALDSAEAEEDVAEEETEDTLLAIEEEDECPDTSDDKDEDEANDKDDADTSQQLSY